MTKRQWTPEELQEGYTLKKAGKTWAELAAHFDCTPESIRNAMRGHGIWTPETVTKAEATLKLATVPEAEPAKPKEPPTVPEQIAHQRDRARTRADIAELKRLTGKRAWIEEIRDAIRESVLTVETPSLIPEAKLYGTFDEEIAVLLLGDVHVGQHTPGRINAGWHQDVDTTAQQMQRLGDVILHRWEVQRRSIPWRKLVILDLGDDVEGSNMRPSQHRIVDPLVAQQSTIYGRLLADLVLRCLTVFEHVRVERVPGNHGRVSEKAGNAGLDVLGPENSWDWVGGEVARAILQEPIRDNRVTIINHENWYARTEVFDWPILFEHGSSERGGGGFGGIPAYGLTRMGAAYRDLEGDYALLAIGHWHRAMWLPTGYRSWIAANGSFPPTTPFVASAKHSATRPTQTLLSIHPKECVTDTHWVYLDTVRDAGHGLRSADPTFDAAE